MVWNLSPDEIAKHWDLIKYGAEQVNKPPDPGVYFLGLLKEILSDKAQVWFMADSEKNIKAMTITKIVGNIAGINELVVDTLYGYSPMTLTEQKKGFEAFAKFAKNIGVASIKAYVSDKRVGKLAKGVGMTKLCDVYKIQVEGKA